MNAVRRCLGGLVVLSLLVTCLSVPVQGAETVIAVTATTDDLTRNGNCTLREAIQAVNTGKAVDACPAGTSGATIQLGEGTYLLSIPGQGENHNQTGDLDILKSVKINGVDREKTILDGGRIDRVLDVVAPDAVVQLSMLGIQNGLIMDPPPEGVPDPPDEPYGNGGGIRNFGHLNGDHLMITHNLVDEAVRGTGAGVYNAGTLALQDTLFTKNTAAYDGGAISSTGTLTLENVGMNGDYGYGSSELHVSGQGSQAVVTGGDMSYADCGSPAGNTVIVGEGAALTLNHVRIEQNNCSFEIIDTNGDLTVQDSFIGWNSAEDAIINQHAGTLTIKNSTIARNMVQREEQRGVVRVTGGTVNIENSTLDHNQGQIVMLLQGVAEAINSTMSSNYNSFDATGIEVDAGSLTLESVTLSNNQGNSAGLVVRGGTVQVHNSLIANNSNLAGEAFDCQLTPGTTLSLGYNLIGVSDGCGWEKANGDLVGTRTAPVDPRLDALLDNGGATSTMALLPGSPAIDTGDPLHFLATDQRGGLRPQGKRSDIGAFEGTEPPAEINTQFIYLPAVKR